MEGGRRRGREEEGCGEREGGGGGEDGNLQFSSLSLTVGARSSPRLFLPITTLLQIIVIHFIAYLEIS